MDFYDLSRDFLSAAEEDASDVNLTKFLCGIQIPLFRKLKVNKLPHFGALHRYSFQNVKKWVNKEYLLKRTDSENVINADQSHQSSNNCKTFIVLAASRKYGGYCIAGKEWSDGKIGPWVRPVSRSANGELAAEDIRMNNNELPRLMDILEVETRGAGASCLSAGKFLCRGKTTLDMAMEITRCSVRQTAGFSGQPLVGRIQQHKRVE